MSKSAAQVRVPGETPPAAEDVDADTANDVITVSRGELAALVATQVAAAVRSAGIKQAPSKVQRNLPTVAEAKQQARASLAAGIAPIGIETVEGWYVHPKAYTQDKSVAEAEV